MADKNQVKLRVVDQLHLSSVKADTMCKGEEFETDAATAKSLVERGLATRVSAPRKAPSTPARGAKADAAPDNKKAAAPPNKAAPAPIAAPAPRRRAGGRQR